MKAEKSVEKNIKKLLNDYGLSNELTLEKIKDWVFKDEGDSAIKSFQNSERLEILAQ